MFCTKEIMVLVSIKCPHLPQNRKVAQTSLNIHLIVAGIEKKDKRKKS